MGVLQVIFFQLTVLFLVFPSSSHSTNIEGSLVGTGPGDTISILIKGTTSVEIISVKLDYIYGPESDQPLHKKLKSLIQSLCHGKTVQVKINGISEENKKIGQVFIGNIDLVSEILSNGYAWYFPYISDDLTYRNTFEEARKQRKGIFQDPKAKPPWLLPDREEQLRILHEKWKKDDLKYLATYKPERKKTIGPNDIVYNNPFGNRLPKILYNRGSGNIDISHRAFTDGLYTQDRQGQALYLERNFVSVPIYDNYTGEIKENINFNDLSVFNPNSN